MPRINRTTLINRARSEDFVLRINLNYLFGKVSVGKMSFEDDPINWSVQKESLQDTLLRYMFYGT